MRVEPDRGGSRLVHRPLEAAAGAPDDRSQEFVLTGELPSHHPLFNDGSGRFHDPQAAFEMVRRVGEGIGHSHFGIQSESVGIFYRFGLTTGDVSSWRQHGTPGAIAVTLRVRPDKVISGVPRSLEFSTRFEIDGTAAGTGTASLLLLTPVLHRSHREHSRATTLAAAERALPHNGGDAHAAGPEPEEVGRARAANVLLCSPVDVEGDRLSATVRPADSWAAGGAPAGFTSSPTMALEVLRQTALLAAHRLYGLDPRHSTPASLHTHFRGYAEPDLPMRCVAVAQQAGHDATGRLRVPFALTLTQAGRAVTEATMSVVEDL
ncbi:AfsA-related hotdog domain-containing protein [Streptomyces sp. AC154]|uniref:AfsA-related hotdog domain-containing protein n=1 Tax=Streptomyces sp. AC154 TaxID=3143184 RepID=UPI003F7DE1E1